VCISLGRLDRGASVRLYVAPTIKDVDPTTATNLDCRAADVSGNPYLMLGALGAVRSSGVTR